MKSNLPPILVVDDEPNMRETVSQLLMDEGYLADTAGSAEQALEMLNEADGKYFMIHLQFLFL